MNIFDALSQGNGKISETNITSFVSYILNENNNFSSVFLALLFEEIDLTCEVNTPLKKLLKVPESSYRKQAEYISNNFSYSAIPEYRLQNKRNIQIVDIFVSIFDKKTSKELCVFLIEIKINKNAINHNDQCLKQYKIYNLSEDREKNIAIFTLLITPEQSNFKVMIDEVKKENPLSVWLKWESEKTNSIASLLRKLVRLENNAEIAPIETNTLFILKSFIEHISLTLSAQDKSPRNMSISGSKVIDYIEFNLENKKHYLKLFDNKMIRIFDENDELQEVEVKPILRKIIDNYSLPIDLQSKTGQLKNTQILGKEIINLMTTGVKA